MAKFQFTVSNNEINFFCDQDGYQPLIPDPMNPGSTMANPELPSGFLTRRVAEFIQGTARAGKRKSKEAARLTEDAADAAVIVIAPGTVS